MKYDLLIKGGRVIDPATGVRGPLDIAIKDGRIVDRGNSIPSDSAGECIDATNQLVTPGLVDLHTHIYHGVTYWGIDPNPVAARTGVTAWLDAGSAGALSINGFAKFIVPAAVPRVKALINISSIGAAGPDFELENLTLCDPVLLERLAGLHSDIVVGVKVRMGASTVGSNGVEPLRRARQAADLIGGILMMHISSGPPPLADCLPFLRAGDVLTHCFTGRNMRITDEQGRLQGAAQRAWDDGVLMDLGHGSGGFSFDVAEPLISSGHAPNVISTDIHQLSVGGPMYDLPTCMSKCMAIGMTLEDVVAAATINPAKAMKFEQEIGSLAVGRRADIAIFRLAPGPVRYYDVDMDSRIGRERLIPERTIVSGRTLTPGPLTPEPWATDDYVWPRFNADLVIPQREELNKP